MSVLRDPGTFHDDGERDRRRHHERVRSQIAARLREQIGDEELITAGPDRRIRVPVTGQRDWRFVFDRGTSRGVGQAGDGDGQGGGPGQGEGVGRGGLGEGAVEYEVELDMEEVEQHLFEQLGLPRLVPRGRQETDAEAISWDDRARRGPLLDKKATLRTNLRRNAAAGRARIGDFDPDDIRYQTYREQRRPVSQAVVFLLLDVSGSMGAFEKRVARLFFWWATRFLRHRYATTEIVFIAHHTEATECTEQEFFTRRESGGTRASSAYELLLEVQRHRYPTAEWNVFVAHCSDGDNFTDDNDRLVELVAETARVANLVGFCQIEHATRYHWGGPHLLAVLEDAAIDGVVSCKVTADTEIWGALKTIFSPTPEEVRT
jgi:uncharacterized protein